ncbi:hypothetical protein ACHAP5_008264 [Fusarium lateritium]
MQTYSSTDRTTRRTRTSRPKSAESRANHVAYLKLKIKEFWPKGEYYPSKHKPKNPDCPNILGAMYSATQRWVKLGRNVDEIWAENGLMGQSIEKTGKRIFGQISLREARGILEEFEREKAQEEEAGPEVILPRKKKHVIRAYGSQPESLDTDSPSKMPKHNINVTPESSSFDSSSKLRNFTGLGILPTRDPPTGESPPANPSKSTSTPSQPRGVGMLTIDALQQGRMLWSKHIWECVESLTIPPDWKVFDPGFPFTNENHIGNRDRMTTGPRHLVFFCHSRGHWSLCHVDTLGDEIFHYNSFQSIVMPLDSLQTWLKANKIGSDMTISDKACPQQKDDQSCGLYALVFLRTLLEEKEMPSDVDLNLERSYFAAMVAAQNESSSIQRSAPDALDTPTFGQIEQEISPDKAPSPTTTSDSPEYRGPSRPSSLTWPVRKPQLVPSSPPNTTRVPSPGVAPDMSIVAKEASDFLVNYLSGFRHIKLIHRQRKATQADRDEEFRSAKKKLELRQDELELKRQQVEDMKKDTTDLGLHDEGDLQIRHWLEHHPPVAGKSWRKWVGDMVAVIDAKRAEAFAEGTERISQLEDLQSSLSAIEPEVKSLEEEVAARRLSLREAVLIANESKADLERLTLQRAKAFEDNDVDGDE